MRRRAVERMEARLRVMVQVQTEPVRQRAEPAQTRVALRPGERALLTGYPLAAVLLARERHWVDLPQRRQAG